MNSTKISINLTEYSTTLELELPYLLSEIEVSLLYQLLQGYSVIDISKRRNRSIKTVSCQKIKLYKKIGVKNDLSLWRDVFLRFKVSIRHKDINYDGIENLMSPDVLSQGM